MVKISVKTIVKALVFNEKGEVLLLRRGMTAPRRPGQWDFPGGFVDEHEDPGSAALRELAEEAGVDDVAGELVYASTTLTENKENVCSLYYLVRIDNQPSVHISWEHDEFVWKPVDEAVDMLEYEPQIIALKYVGDNIWKTNHQVDNN